MASQTFCSTTDLDGRSDDGHSFSASFGRSRDRQGIWKTPGTNSRRAYLDFTHKTGQMNIARHPKTIFGKPKFLARDLTKTHWEVSSLVTSKCTDLHTTTPPGGCSGRGVLGCAAAGACGGVLDEAGGFTGNDLRSTTGGAGGAGCELPEAYWHLVGGAELLRKLGLMVHTPWKTNMDPENHWLVEENTLPGGQDVRVHVSFRECNSVECWEAGRRGRRGEESSTWVASDGRMWFTRF